MPAHHLDDHDAVVRLGGRVQAVDRLGRDRDRGVEPERVVGAVQVVVDRLRDADDREGVLRVQLRGDAERVLAADRDERVELLALERREHLLDPAFDLVRVRARRAEDRPAPGQDPRDLAPAERLDDPVDEPAPALPHGGDLPAAVERPPRHRADDRVQPRAVAAAGEDSEPRHSASLRRVRVGLAKARKRVISRISVSALDASTRPPARGGRTPSAGPTGAGRETMTRTHKLVNLAGIVLPFVGLVVAIIVLWERMVGPTELAILAVGYVLTGVGITVGYHRLFTHRSFETYRGVRYTFAVLGGMAVEGDVARLGLRPPEAPSVLRPGRRSAQPARRVRRRHRRRAARALARPHRLALLSRGPRRAVALRQGPAARPRHARDREALPAARALLARRAGGRRLAPDRRLVRLLRGALLGRRRPDLPAPARDVLDQLDLPPVGPPALRVARRVAQRVVALLALVRRVVAQQPPRVPQLGVPRPPPRRRSIRAAG